MASHSLAGFRVLGSLFALAILFVSQPILAQKLTLSWTDNSYNEQGFEIERSFDGISFQKIASVPSNVTQFVDSGVEVDREYWYRVRAYNQAGHSGFTNVAKGTAVLEIVGEELSDDDGTDSTEQEPQVAEPVLHGPVISAIGDIAIEQGLNYVDLEFSVTDMDTNTSNIVISINSSNQALVSKKGIGLYGTGSDKRLRLAPMPNVPGSTIISIEASDGVTTSVRSFEFSVADSSASVEAPSSQNPNSQGQSVLSVPDNSETEIPEAPSNDFVPGVEESRFVGVSIRSLLQEGPEGMSASFVVHGEAGASKRILLRALGPSLTKLNVGGAANDTSLELYRIVDDVPELLAENEDWDLGEEAETIEYYSRMMGALPLEAGARDSAIVVDISPGIYSAVVRNESGDGGIALVEMFDTYLLDTEVGFSRFVNISSRGRIVPGAGAIIAGFVVQGKVPKKLLIRGIGDELSEYGVTDTLSNPNLRIFRTKSGISTLVAENDDWGGDANIDSLAQLVGAFPMDPNSKSAALVVELEPGVYTAQASSSENGSGIALVEVYELPSD